MGEKTTISSDLIEAFVFGNDESSPKTLKHDYFASDPKNEEKYWSSIANSYNNQWPKESASENFKKTMKKGFSLSAESCRSLLLLLASNLGISAEQLTLMHNKDDHTMEIKHYLPISAPKRPVPTALAANISMNSELDNDGEAIRVKSHADLSTLTLLTQNLETKGLQILIDSEDGGHTWLDAPPIPEAVLLNSGDVLEVLSGGKLLSTKHRVIADETSSISRFSVVQFYVPNWETRMGDKVLFGDMTPF